MVDYNQEYYKTPEESMYDYMQRISQARQGGVLGTQGMLAQPEITDKPLAEVTQSCPVGYAWDGQQCVPVGAQGGDSNVEIPKPMIRTPNNDFGYADPAIGLALGALFPGAGLLVTANNAEAVAKAQEFAQLDKTGWLDRATINPRTESIGQTPFKSLENPYQVSLGGGLVSKPEGIVERLFGMSKQSQVTSLTPLEVRMRGMFAERMALQEQADKARRDAELQAAIDAETNRAAAESAGGAGGNWGGSGYESATYDSSGWNPGDGGGYISNTATGNDWDNF